VGDHAGGSGSDLEFRFNQLALPDDLPDDFADALVARAAEAGLTSEAVFEPGSEPRDVVSGTILLVIHIVNAEGLSLLLGVASGAMWDGIKALWHRAKRGAKPDAPPVRILVSYQDGQEFAIDVDDPEQVGAVVKQLRAAAATP
jgi:hypothetical protein